MADAKTDSSSTPLSDDPDNPTKGLSAKPNAASHPAGAEPALDTLFHRTSLRLCCAHSYRTPPQINVLPRPDRRYPASGPRYLYRTSCWR